MPDRSPTPAGEGLARAIGLAESLTMVRDPVRIEGVREVAGEIVQILTALAARGEPSGDRVEPAADQEEIEAAVDRMQEANRALGRRPRPPRDIWRAWARAALNTEALNTSSNKYER